jgi:hypothetical protein
MRKYRPADDAHILRLAVAPKDISVTDWKQIVFVWTLDAFSHGPAGILENHSSNRARRAKS